MRDEIMYNNIEVIKVKCSNCGADIADNSKFCSNCGVAISTFTGESPRTVKQDGTYTARQQEYVGKVFKCPQCGSAVTETMAICPVCGIQITGRTAVSSISAFKEQLMAIEKTRKHGSGGFFGAYFAADKADIQKLSLIRNFPIPNSIDDCLEFMLLAIANIDVSLSKNTFSNRLNKSNQLETRASIAGTISDAWVAKMQQIYRKAEIAFPYAPAFITIKDMYINKMKELKMKA